MMRSPQVADGGDGLKILRVAADIGNKQSRTADRGWLSSLGNTGKWIRVVEREKFGVGRTHLVQDRDRWQGPVKTVMFLRTVAPCNWF
jgi:hypothetical protein